MHNYKNTNVLNVHGSETFSTHHRQVFGTRVKT